MAASEFCISMSALVKSILRLLIVIEPLKQIILSRSARISIKQRKFLPLSTIATLLYKERLETFNDFFVFLNVALFRSDCVIIYILFWLAAQRINSV